LFLSSLEPLAQRPRRVVFVFDATCRTSKLVGAQNCSRLLRSH
jgi:hypothetical protein